MISIRIIRSPKSSSRYCWKMRKNHGQRICTRYWKTCTFNLGVKPNIQEDLISDLQNLIISGDGSILETAASGSGRPSCACRAEGIYQCDHNRYYTSPTAQWCYDHYFGAKNVIPIIPLSRASQNAYPHLSEDSDICLNLDGVPICPAGKPMRRHAYSAKKQEHLYNCPAKRGTHRNGKFMYVFHKDECPRQQDCEPHSPLGPYVHLNASLNPRLFPPLPRSSRKFKEFMKQRSASERCNFNNDAYNIEGASRNADYGLIRLTLANIAHHAVIRYQVAKKNSSANAMQTQILEGALSSATLEYQDSS